jgi:spore coat assembly protein
MYHPDILVVTGHDSLIRSGRNLYNLYNYKNSKYFVETVRMARKWAPSNDKLVIIAGACQSFYEAIMNENADFASSPGRILIDFVDPIIIAKKVASTDRNKFVSINDIAGDLNSGIRGIGGGTVRGKRRMVLKK